jgi:hypothetical protein
MFNTGFDSGLLAKDFVPLEKFLNPTVETSAETTAAPAPETSPTEVVVHEEKPKTLKALIGASVTTQDPDFDDHYQAMLKSVFEKYGLRQEKPIYKGAHLVKQIGANFEDVFTDILNGVGSAIAHIDLYFATYPRQFVSILGRGQGQRLGPMEYMESHQNGFAHACAWWHWKNYSKGETEYQYHIDHFEAKGTPAWKEMEANKVNMRFYYSGCECNCLISFADLILKMIDEFHFGSIDYRSISQPIRKRTKTYALMQKARCFDLSKYDWVIKATVPDTPININLNNYIKHPICFIAWTPTLPRKTVKPSFEWSHFYNAVIKKAMATKGCVKLLDFDKDMTFWEADDFIIPWQPADEEHVKELESMGFNNMPTILKATDIIT